MSFVPLDPEMIKVIVKDRIKLYKEESNDFDKLVEKLKDIDIMCDIAIGNGAVVYLDLEDIKVIGVDELL